MGYEIEDFADLFKASPKGGKSPSKKGKGAKKIGSKLDSRAGQGRAGSFAPHPPGTATTRAATGGGKPPDREMGGRPRKDPSTTAGSKSVLSVSAAPPVSSRPTPAKAKIPMGKSLFPLNKSFNLVQYMDADEEALADQFGQIAMPSMRNLQMEQAENETAEDGE